MPAVVTFWQLPEDEKDFLSFLLTTGNIVAIPDCWVKLKEDLAPKAVVSYIGEHDPGHLRLALEGHALQAVIETKELRGDPFFALDSMRSCVMTYSRGKLRDGNKPAQFNLSADYTYPNRDGTILLDKDREFVRWAKKVLSWVRQATPELVECNGHRYRATKRVRDAVREGRLEVVL
jgi:hypothetical protein